MVYQLLLHEENTLHVRDVYTYLLQQRFSYSTNVVDNERSAAFVAFYKHGVCVLSERFEYTL